MSRAKNRILGEAVEDLIIDRLDLFGYAGDEYDAVVGARTMRPIEIKATRATYRNGRSGRFRLRKRQHDALDDAGGMYVFALYDGDGEESLSIRDEAIISTDGVERNIAPNWTSDAGRAGGRKAKISWRDVPGLEGGSD
jgi:hypothetical protein